MVQSDTISSVLSRVDTLYIDRVDPMYNEEYIKLLERSNEQLSLVGNPLAWMIGSLGVLFTVGAIFSAYLLWRQSKEFKEEEDRILNDLAALRDKYKLDLENLVTSHQEQMNATNQLLKTMSQHGKVENSELEKLRGSIHRSTNAIKRATRDVPLTITEHRRGTFKCAKCKEGFPVDFDLSPSIRRGSHETFKKKCPKCGHINHVTINR